MLGGAAPAVRLEETPIVSMTGFRLWALAGTALACWASVAAAQVTPAPQDDAAPRTTVAPAREVLQAWFHAQDLVAERQFAPACRLLQSILDGPEDFFLEEDSSESLKQGVRRVLTALPAEGREAYELQFGAEARALWERYAQQGDRSALAEVLRRFELTRAGAVAAEHLAQLHFDRGQSLAAALVWRDLERAHPSLPPPTAAARVQRALAWFRAGRRDQAARELEELRAAPAGALRLGGRDIGGPARQQELLPWLQKAVPDALLPTPPAWDWPMLRGAPSRNAAAAPAGPVGGTVWRQATLAGPFDDIDREADEAPRQWLQEQVARVDETLRSEDLLTLPGMHPLVVRGLVIARTLTDLAAYDLRTGEVRWRSAPTDATILQLFRLSQREDQGRILGHQAALARLRLELYRDLTRGSLSSDGEYVYVLDTVSYAQQAANNREANPPPTNRLTAFEIETGRLAWEVGGPRADEQLELAGHFFLGPPVVVDGDVYCLAEVGGELRLLQLRPDRARQTAELASSQSIAAPDALLQHSLFRVCSGLSPSAAESLLICPTSAGLAAAVDPVRRQLRWGYRYASFDRRREPFRGFLAPPEVAMTVSVNEEESRWTDNVATVAEGRVLLTPRDSDELHCLDIVDGRLLWKRPRDQWLYVACVQDGVALLVGRSRVDALRLDTGAPAWSTPTPIPMPAGRGVLVERHYLLPLSTGEIVSVETATGRIIARSTLPEGRSPGNLAAGEGALVSQSVQELTAYRRLGEMERQALDRLAQNPRDAQALALRGELRLHQGDEQRGLEDLRRSLLIEATPVARRVLAGTLIDGLRTDFSRYRAAAAEIDALATDPSQRASFLRLLGEGLERSGERVEAFRQYVKLSQTADFENQLERVDGLLAVRGDRVVRGRVAALDRSATADERQQMERELQPLVEATPQDDADRARCRRFLRYFAGHPAADAVRLQLLQSLPPHEPEVAELWLQLSASPVRARAAAGAAGLAEWYAEQRPLLAAPWFARLEREFGDDVCSAGKTGKELAAAWRAAHPDLAQDPGWPAGPYEPRRTARVRPAEVRPVEVVGSRSPAFEGWTFETVHASSAQLVGRDRRGRVRWQLNLPIFRPAQQFRFSSLPPASLQLHMAGNWLALELDSSFVVWDASDTPPRRLWHQSLLVPAAVEGTVRSTERSAEFVANGRRRVRAVDYGMRAGGSGGSSFVGTLIAATADAVFYQIGTRLHAAEPETGRPLWVRQDIGRQTEVTADRNFVTILNSETEEALVLRAVDGAEVARRDVGDEHGWLWFRGDRLATLKFDAAGVSVRCEELAPGRELWRRNWPRGTRVRTVDDRQLVAVDPQGRVEFCRLDDGSVQFAAQLPAIPNLTFVWVQPGEAGYVVVAGNSSPRGGRTRVSPIDSNQVLFEGRVALIADQSGEVVWNTEVGATGFDVLQAANSPLLTFAARVAGGLDDGSSPFGVPRWSAQFFDRRTGELLYSTQEPAGAGALQIEYDGDRQTIFAQFPSWAIEFTPVAADEAPRRAAPQ